jgi:hypothetical protein
VLQAGFLTCIVVDVGSTFIAGRLLFGLVFLVALPGACLVGPSTPGGEKTCEANCDRQVAAGCSKTGTDFSASCKQACLVYRADYPDCVSLMNAMSACVERKVTFTCEPSGTVSANPVAVCANEEYACSGCTGDFTACRN